MKNILVVAASNQNNLELAKFFVEEIKAQGAEAMLVDLVEEDLPLYTPKNEAEGVPVQATELAKKMENIDGMVFTAPEYNGSIPPTLNNFIAWISRTGKTWREVFNEKKAVIATHSGSGGVNVLNAMRQQLSYVGMNVIGRQIHTHMKKELSKDSLQNVVKQLLD